MKKSCFLIGIGIVAIIAVAAFFYIRFSITGTATPLPLTVSITRPAKGGSYPISGALSIRGEAISGAPITKLEFWADGKLINTVQAPVQDLYVFGHTWSWTPKTLEDHTLIVRAYDSRGQNSSSSVIHIQGVPDPGMIVVVTASQGDTLQSLATQYHTSIDAILAANKNLDPNAPLSGDIFVPVPPPAENGTSSEPTNPTTTSSKPATQPGPNLSFTSWIRLDVVNPIEELFAPTAPQLSAAAAGCNVQLTINDLSVNEKGFYVYRLDPQTNDFVKIGTLANHEGTGTVQYTDNNLFGAYQYYVSAYDNSGEGVSNFVKVDVDGESCAQLADTFTPAQLVNFGANQVDQVYCPYTGSKTPAFRRQFSTPQ